LKPRFTFISSGVGWKRDAILRRSEERKEGERRRSAPFFAVPSVGLVGWWVGCAASGFASAASRLHYVG